MQLGLLVPSNCSAVKLQVNTVDTLFRIRQNRIVYTVAQKCYRRNDG